MHLGMKGERGLIPVVGRLDVVRDEATEIRENGFESLGVLRISEG